MKAAPIVLCIVLVGFVSNTANARRHTSQKAKLRHKNLVRKNRLFNSSTHATRGLPKLDRDQSIAAIKPFITGVSGRRIRVDASKARDRTKVLSALIRIGDLGTDMTVTGLSRQERARFAAGTWSQPRGDRVSQRGMIELSKMKELSIGGMNGPEISGRNPDGRQVRLRALGNGAAVFSHLLQKTPGKADKVSMEPIGGRRLLKKVRKMKRAAARR